MIRRFHLLLLFSLVLCVSTSYAQVNLLDKRDLSAWDFFVEKDSVGAADVFSFSDAGILACKGTPFGYLATKEVYKNFKLSLEYRWPEGVKPTNSGIFLRINAQPAKTFLPRCVEVQLAHKSAGDLWGFHGMGLPGPAGSPDARVVAKDGGEVCGMQAGVKKILDTEKEPGQWNALDILCSDGLIVIALNGRIVNWVTDAEIRPGRIGFQSEGGPIEFRKAMLNVLP